MSVRKLLFIFFSLSVTVPAGYCQDTPSLGDIARQNRARKQGSPTPESPGNRSSSAPGTSTSTPVTKPAVSSVSERAAEESDAAVIKADAEREFKLHFADTYANGIRLALDGEQFEALDQIADKARSTKSRLPGGYWTLHAFYVGISGPQGGTDASETEFTAHFAKLKKWIAQRPQSVTPRIALASAYLQYGWKARGTGYANEVTEEGWRLYHERANIAAKMLIDAYALPTKCPQWYTVMYTAAEDLERGQAVLQGIFDKAVAFEPEYHYIYQSRAHSLLPEWGGGEGEMAAFAEKTADRLGGKKGDIIYYRIANEMLCDCDDGRGFNGLSWERIKRGFRANEELYGESLIDVNKVCGLAVMAGDAAYAQELFSRIGEFWDPATWEDKKGFQVARAWARQSVLAQNIVAALKAADENLQTPAGREYDKQIAKTFAANYGAAAIACRNSANEPDLPPVDLALQIGANGEVEKVYTSYTSATTSCLGAKVQTGVFAAPPRPSYWVKISVQMQR